MRRDFDETEFGEGALKLFLDLEKSFVQGRAFGAVVEGAFEVVEGGEERGDDGFAGGAGEVLFFAGDAFAIVLVVGGGAEEFVPVFGGLGGVGLELGEFGFGKGDGLGRFWRGGGCGRWCLFRFCSGRGDSGVVFVFVAHTRW